MESKSLNKILYIFLSILFLVPSCSKNNKLYDYSKSCKKTSNISLSKRIENYPFNISKKIIFISYQQNKLGVEGTELTNYLEKLKFNIKDVNQAYFLDQNNINELTNLFYNIGSTDTQQVTMNFGCFTYKNAILFLDENDILIEYIKFSFECNQTETSNKNVTTGEGCTYKIFLIEDLFKKYNINTR